jgi:hypothetical protein
MVLLVLLIDCVVRLPYFHGLILGHAHTSVHCLILPQFPSLYQSVVEHTLLSRLFMYCSFANIGHADVMWFIVLSYR